MKGPCKEIQDRLNQLPTQNWKISIIGGRAQAQNIRLYYRSINVPFEAKPCTIDDTDYWQLCEAVKAAIAFEDLRIKKLWTPPTEEKKVW